MAKTITVKTRKSDRSVPVVWQGENLSVHRPISSKNPTGLCTEPRHWAITHTASGLGACTSFDGPKADAIALAQLWDKAFGSLNPDNPRAWQYGQTWVADCRLAQWSGTERPHGPILPDNPTPSDVAAAMAAAIGSTYEPLTADESAEPFPAHETMPADRVRMGDSWPGMPCPDEGWPQVFWRGQWWPVPTLGEVEAMALDSLAETPDGRTVEPDAPDAWPRILGVI